jgi:hypothetical protein
LKTNIEREREEEEETSWVVVRDTIFVGRGIERKSYILVLKVPRQCPLVLLVEAAHLTGIIFF